MSGDVVSSRHSELAGFIWSVADLLRGDYRQSEYGKVILPFTVLRRLDCVLAPTRQAVHERAMSMHERGIQNVDRALTGTAGASFYNVTDLDFGSIVADADNVRANLLSYLGGFSPSATEVMDKFDLAAQLDRLDQADLLYLVTSKFAGIDLSPATVDNHQMGYLFEELIRRFSELSNETAGEHFTPREVIRLMVGLLVGPADQEIQQPGIVRTVLDPACGTGGMLSACDDYIRELNPDANVVVYGQELNPESYAICRSDMMIKGQEASNIKFGNSFSNDGHQGQTFNYLLANPPFGVEWKKVKTFVEDEASHGFGGRFGAGLPRINDGSLLFLQHMISKMKPVSAGGSRVAIVFNGSPLFTGGAGSGESEIRRWILDNDWLEAIVALPDQLFYNTGISTYFWILTNRKDEAHRDKVVLLDARGYWTKMRKSLGDKRKQVADEQITEITRLYGRAMAAAADEQDPLHDKVKVFDRRDFGYHRITVERPLKLRFEITEDGLAELSTAKPLAKFDGRDALVKALQSLVGQPPSHRKVDFAGTLAAAYADAGLSKPPTNVQKAVWSAVSIADPAGELQTDRKGDPLPDPDLRDNENVPLREDIQLYFAREVLPHVPDAWIDDTKTRVGYEIPFTRHFYKYVPPRPLAEIDTELKSLEAEIQSLLKEVTE